MKNSSSFLMRSRLRLATGVAALALGLSVHAASDSSWWVAVVNDQAAAVREELARGADPNALDADKLPTLMLAIRSGAWQVYDALLAHRHTEIDIENQHGETPLMYLALLGETERAAALIKRGAKVNRLGWTPLHYAASRGQTDTGRLLIQHGAIIHAPAPDGTTPLMMAAYSGDRDMVQLLLDNGADATAINLNKHTAADWARERRHSALADELDAIARRTVAQREGRPVPPDAGRSVAPAPAPAPATGNAGRYFDLNRFEDED